MYHDIKNRIKTQITLYESYTITTEPSFNSLGAVLYFLFDCQKEWLAANPLKRYQVLDYCYDFVFKRYPIIKTKIPQQQFEPTLLLITKEDFCKRLKITNYKVD